MIDNFLQVGDEKWLLVESNWPDDDKPLPKPNPDVMWHVQDGDGQMPLFVNHDEISRTVDTSLWGLIKNLIASVFPFWFVNLKYTNETVVCRRYSPFEGKVYVNGRVTNHLDRMREWVYELLRHMGEDLLDSFVNHGFGFCDGDADDTDPYFDEVKLDVLDCGGNRRNGLQIIDWHGSKYVEIEHQDFFAGPNILINYDSHPHLMEKQVDVGDLGNGIFWRTSSAGDVIWPFVSFLPIVHELRRVHFYPELPFSCKLYGFSAIVDEYGFTGSDTWVHVSDGELDSGWYQADGMNVPVDRANPTPGTWKDYFRNISDCDWPGGPTPPIANWHK